MFFIMFWQLRLILVAGIDKHLLDKYLKFILLSRKLYYTNVKLSKKTCTCVVKPKNIILIYKKHCNRTYSVTDCFLFISKPFNLQSYLYIFYH